MKLARRQAGFSLIEVICAIAVLGIALVGLTQGITAALSSTKESEVQTTASMIAAGQIEALRADGFVTDGITEGDCGDDLPLYQWKQTVKSTTIEGLHEVEVVVENSKTGKSILDLRTMLFDPPVETTAGETTTKKSKDKSRDRRGGRA